ncbi:kinase-like domain-containing protein [Syncephalis fuscata]|nr:kinase-like domain-containing protein [Syncephalis fuscata]
MLFDIRLKSIIVIAVVVCSLTSNTITKVLCASPNKAHVTSTKIIRKPLKQSIAREYPEFSSVAGLTDIKWISKKANIITLKAYFFQKPVFLKCAKQKAIYTKELNIIKKIFNSNPGNDECGLPYWVHNLFLPITNTFTTNNGFDCTVYPRTETTVSLREFIDQASIVDRYKAAYSITRQLLMANAYLHCKNIIHRNIQPNSKFVRHLQYHLTFVSDILIDIDNTGLVSLKLINFYNAIEVPSSMEGRLTCVTLAYCSPETFVHGIKFSFTKSESWAIGVVLYELLMKRLPYGNSLNLNIKEIKDRYKTTLIKAFNLKKIQHELIEIDSKFNGIADQYNTIAIVLWITLLLLPDPAQRYTPHEMLMNIVFPHEQEIFNRLNQPSNA